MPLRSFDREKTAVVVGAIAVSLALGGAVAVTSAPATLALAAIAGIAGITIAVTFTRWALVGSLFLLVSYLPDVAGGSAHKLASEALPLMLVLAVFIRHVSGVERVRLPTDYKWYAFFGVALVVATAAADHRNLSELTDFTGFAVLAAVMLMIIDSDVWLRRAMWAIVSGVALLAVLSLEQQLTKSFGRTFGGLALVIPDRGSMRSSGPLSPDYFAQVLVAAGALAAYLALGARSIRERWLAVGATAVMFVVVVYTLSRGALVAAAVAAIAAMLFRGMPIWKVGVAAGCVAVGGLLFLPPTLQSRVGDLASLTAGGNASDSSLRGRVAENLAALEIARDNAILGVGPDNFELHYLAYAQRIGLDSRAEVRGAHSLYLGSLAELGLVGAIPLFVLLWMGLRRSWQARFGAGRELRLLAEGCLVAWLAFLASAVALHLSYPRYLWIFLGLAFTAGQFHQHGQFQERMPAC